jgi:hypothetical protein
MKEVMGDEGKDGSFVAKSPRMLRPEAGGGKTPLEPLQKQGTAHTFVSAQ